MEPRKAEAQKSPEQSQAHVKKSRFQIVRLEERIAPRRSCYYGCQQGGWGRGGSGGHVGHGKW